MNKLHKSGASAQCLTHMTSVRGPLLINGPSERHIFEYQPCRGRWHATPYVIVASYVQYSMDKLLHNHVPILLVGLSRKIWTGEKIGPGVHFFPRKKWTPLTKNDPGMHTYRTLCTTWLTQLSCKLCYPPDSVNTKKIVIRKKALYKRSSFLQERRAG